MKKLLFLLLVLAGLNASAQTKALQTVTIKLPTVQCEMAKGQIETYLKRYDGVNSVVVNVKKKEVVVKYLVDRVSDEDIKAAIANVGYDANEVTAEPDAVKRLPACCRKTATAQN
ncbi:copper chaperone [Flaviaesturariibacter flavus]|uniref:Copper chaperone n=1 Tax=Flaviaesturariibacter flavus TaxID=2502780 RepID=A0A4R1BNM1_9BACT|nr:cation transporter [Flaviaesturariibacter flavus]TCJ18998.1 copper chaperone [Flaviaesturariibacter flavus]